MQLRGRMSLLCYFKRLPSEQDTGFGEVATKEANQRVQALISQSQGIGKRKQKVYAVYTDEQQAQIGQLVADNKNVAALKHFSDFPDLSKSTIRGFGTKYLAATKKVKTGKIVATIQSQKRGPPLAL